MVFFIVLLAVCCVLLMVLLLVQDRESMKLRTEIAVLKERTESLQVSLREQADQREGDMMSVEGLAHALSRTYKVHGIVDYGMSVTTGGETCHISMSRLPFIYIWLGFLVEPDRWELDLLRKAAHLMSDNVAMVKVKFDGGAPGPQYLTFEVAVRDTTVSGFCANFPSYLGLIDSARIEIDNIYWQLVNEKAREVLSPSPHQSGDD